MLEPLKQNKKLLIAFAIATIFFMWNMLGGSNDTSSNAILISDAQDDTQVVPRTEVDQEIVRLLIDMRSLRLDGSLFVSPGFGMLHDFSREIVPEPQGRPNPFAPISEGTVRSTN